MKKQLLWCAALLLAGLTSCQKDTFKPANQTSVGSKDNLRVAAAPQNYYYVDLLLQPRNAGENYDTYAAMFGLVKIIVTGAPSWNHDLYPDLKNGVPTVVQGIGIAPGYNGWLTYFDNSFVVNVGVPSDFNNTAYQSDVFSYDKAESDWEKKFFSLDNPGLPPLIWDYVKSNYSTQASIVTTTGKLIRVTTGSHWAVATINYPAPAVASANAVSVVYLIDPTRPNTYYNLYWANGHILYTQDPNTKVTGTYTVSGPHLTIYHYVGTITRSDGTTFNFDETTDIS
jgi:hypothetical protein